MNEKYSLSLDQAANQFKLAWHVAWATNIALGPEREPFPQPLIGGTYGRFSIDEDGIKLSPEDAASAGAALQHCATFTLAVAVDTAFEQLIPNRFESPYEDVRSAARIARFIRNAYAHNPFFPRWECRNENQKGVYEIKDVLALDIAAVDGLNVEWQHYGGPIALLKFVEHCKMLLIAHGR